MELAIQQKTIMQMTLEKASKIDLIRNFSQLTLDKIVSANYPSVASLKKQYGVEKTEKVTSILFSDLSASFDNQLSIEQIEELSVEISSTMLKNISLEDIYMVCREIKTSESFGKLNVNKVLRALEKHFDKRCEAVMEYNINKDNIKYQETPAERNSSKALEQINKHKQASIQYLKQQAK